MRKYLFVLSALLSYVAAGQTPFSIITKDNPFCPGQTLHFKNELYNVPQGTTVTTRWSGPNNFTAVGSQIAIANSTPANAGLYSMTATFSGAYTGSIIKETAVYIGPPDSYIGGYVDNSYDPTRYSTLYQGTVFTFCEPRTIELSVYNPAQSLATFVWRGPNGFIATGEKLTLTNAAVGSYAVTATFLNGCGTTTQAYGIGVEPQKALIRARVDGTSPNDYYDGELTICTGSTVVLLAIATKAHNQESNRSATYRWEGPNGFTSTEKAISLRTVSEQMLGTYRLTVTYTDDCPGVVVKNFTLKKPVLSVSFYPLSADKPVPFCPGQPVQLSASAYGVPQGATVQYRWLGPDNFSSALQSVTLPRMPDVDRAIYSVTASLGSSCGSISKAASLTFVQERPMVKAVGRSVGDPAVFTNAFCPGSAMRLGIQETAPRQEPIALYQWSGPNGFTSTDASPTIPADPTGRTAGLYSLTTTFANCAGTATDTVRLRFAQPQFSVGVGTNYTNFDLDTGKSVAICQGDYFLLGIVDMNRIEGVNATVRATEPVPLVFYESPWKMGQLTSRDTLRLFPSTSGLYSFSVNYSGVCSGSVVLTRQIEATSADVRLVGSLSACVGDTIRLEAIPTHVRLDDADYLWSGPGIFTNTRNSIVIPNVTAATSGPYSVTAIYRNGVCQNAKPARQTTITVLEPPTARFLTADTTIYQGDSLGVRIGLTGTPPWTLRLTNRPDSVLVSQSPYRYFVRPGITTSYQLSSVRNVCGLAPPTPALRVQVAVPLANELPADEDRLRIWPNPAHDPVQVRWLAPAGEAATLRLLGVGGTLLHEFQRRGTGRPQTETWPLTDLPSGVYLIQLTDSTGSVSQRLVKK